MRFHPAASSAPVRFARLAGAAGLVLAWALSASAQAPAPAADPAPARPSDPRAVALLNEVAEAYKALGSYADEGRFVISMTVGDRAQKQEAPLRLTFARPNRINLDAGPVKLVSDGETMNTAIEPLKKFIAVPAPKEITLDVFREGPVGAVLFGGPSGVPMFILTSLLTAPEPAKALERLGGSLQMAGDDAAPALMLTQTDGPGLKLGIDPKTKLLSDIDLVIDPSLLEKAAQQGNKVTVEKLGWTAGAVSTAPAGDDAFVFKAPEGFAKVDSFEAAMAGADGAPQERPRMAVDAKVGQPAPDFSLTLFDGPDKTKVATKADFAGKVVILDFWATWCPPCLAELPEIQKLVDELAGDDAKKDVVVVALSQDREPAEPAEVRKLIEKTLAEKKVELVGKANAAIGLDPTGSIGELFEVEGLPTIVVLDGKGVVQSAHVGFSPDVREKLAAEIDAILAGKPIPGADGTEAAAEAEPGKN